MTRFTGNFGRLVIDCGAFPFETDHRDWLISITDKDNAPANATGFAQVLFLDFDDDEDIDSGKSITQSDADKIASFINNAREADANVWVNCHAGICRSGAVVEVLEMLGWQVVEHHLISKRIPNRLVKDMLRRRFPELLNSWEVV